MASELDILRARIAVLEQLLEVHEETAIRESRRVEATLEELRKRAVQLERSQEALQFSEARKTAIVENALDCIITIDSDGVIIEFNPVAESVFGVPRADALGHLLADLIIPLRYREAHQRGMVRYLETGEGPLIGKRIEITALRNDGEEFPVELAITPITIEGRPFFTGFLRDLSKVKRDQERLRGLTSLTEAALAHLSLDQLLQEFQRRLREILRADTVVVMLIVDDHLVLRSSLGIDEERAKGMTLPIGVGVAGRMAQTRQPLVVDDINSLDYVSPIITDAGVMSLMGAPLLVDDRMIGIVHVGSRTPRAFTQEELSLLVLAADRMSIGIDHARLFEREKSIAQTLQMSMLPDRLPQIDGVSIAARYLPAGDGTRVGGDWYDVIHLPSGEIGMVIGDVAGRGVRAAAVMGQLRHSLRAFAFDGHSPSDVLERLDQIVQAGADEEMATLFFGAFDLATMVMRFASAGHLPPLVVSRDGECTFVEGRRSVPLGVVSGATFQMDEVALEPGSLVFIYTDGLVEERDVSIDEGMERLMKSISVAPHSLEEFCDHVLSATFGGGGPKDDVAFLVFRIDG